MDINAQEVIIGIDLGTTNSEVALIHKGKPYVIKIDGSKIVPSVVSVDAQGAILIGQAAINNELVAPTDTVRCIKRKMGQEDVVQIGAHSYTPPMVSSLILKRLKLAAEEFLKHPVTKAVITVPAFFSEKQREATKEAAELAGLEPVRLLNEPTSAALAYALGRKANETCLVYDLGGGTFDVSIVTLLDQVMEVKASNGDTELGGSDFDRMIAEKARQSFLEQYEVDLAQDPLAWARLMRAAEAAKIRLSTEASAKIVEEFIATANSTPLHLSFEITLTTFEEMIRPAIERSLVSVRKTLEMANLTKKQIDRVILVGGATYTPLVSQLLEEELNIAPQAWLDPSTVVAIGAAIEAGNIAGQNIGPHMVDITPHSLGTTCSEFLGSQYNCILIRRNTPLPCSASRVFYKHFKEQDRVAVEVNQGESVDIHQNRQLGKFLLEGLKDSPSEDVHIKFSLDRSGLLHVTATDVSTGKQINHTLKKVSHSRVKHANMADLASVHISVEENIDDIEFSEESDAVDSDEVKGGFAETQEILPDSVQAISVDFAQDLLVRAQQLLDKASLDPADQEELSLELAKAKSKDEEAVERLSELLYFLE